jgi:hypothetical protein
MDISKNCMDLVAGYERDTVTEVTDVITTVITQNAGRLIRYANGEQHVDGVLNFPIINAATFRVRQFLFNKQFINTNYYSIWSTKSAVPNSNQADIGLFLRNGLWEYSRRVERFGYEGYPYHVNTGLPVQINVQIRGRWY